MDITKLIASYKNYAHKAGLHKEFPDSSNYVSDDIVTRFIIDESMLKLSSLVNVPKDEMPVTENTGSKSVSGTFKAAIYSGKHYGSASIDEIVASDSLQIAVKTSNGIFDARILGGGLNINYIKSAIGSDYKIYSLTDIGRYDGHPIPLHSSLVVEIPVDIYHILGYESVMGIINKYAAAGLNIVIKKYGEFTPEAGGGFPA